MADRPNVLLVCTDQQFAGAMSCAGNDDLETPAMDRLAATGTRFPDTYCAEPLCIPSRASMFTGRMPHELNDDISYEDGFDSPYSEEGFHETVHHGGWGITAISDYWGNDYWDDTYRHNDALQEYEGYCTDVWFEEAMAWMEDRQATDRPFFCYLPTNCPHWPHWVDDEYSDPYGPEEQEEVDEESLAKFFGQIENIDENVGRLLAWMDETGLAEDTILLFMTDNGTVRGHEVFNAGMRGHKRSLYDGGHRVPWYVRWPGGDLGEPRAIDELTRGTDVLPTLIDLCGLARPEGVTFDGVSLSGLLRGDRDELDDRTEVVQYGPDPDRWEAAVLSGPWRLVGGDELYDLRDDPGQEENVAGEHPDVRDAMREHYEEWWDDASEAFETTKYIHIGAEQANPLTLYSNDWRGSYADNFGNLAAGDRTGYWNVVVEADGEYEFELARWPLEADVPLADGIEGPLGSGSAVPIAAARLRVGDADVSRSVAGDETSVTFTVDLEAGESRVETWFYDEAGNELCSAYHTRVYRT